ncbi:MAG: DUF3105 domain-containing protein [Chloroflexi bacterium]|nr:DUF3105 domain-containing protein [Chloroflexota bacterium]
MSREQRRIERKQQGRSGAAQAAAPPSRRTPVKVSDGSRFPVIPIAIGLAAVVMVALLVYLARQTGTTTTPAAEKAAADASASIPGTFVPAQGGAHVSGAFSLERTPTPFCDGVAVSEQARATAGSTTPQATATATSTATSTATPSGDSTGTSSTPNATPTVPKDCYNSNPPSSGPMLGDQNRVDVGGGNLINLPPAPDVYPPEVVVPREAISHLLEHAGVYVGYNCADGDTACQDVVTDLTKLVNARIDNNDNRVVLSRDPDLPFGTVGASSWTRAIQVPTSDWANRRKDIEKFISVNSCRVDMENAC